MPAGMASDGTCRPLRSSASSSSSRAHPVLLDLPDRDLVDVGFTAVAAHQLPLSLQDVSAVNLVVQHVESSPGVNLGRPLRRALQSSNRFDARDGTSRDGTHRFLRAPHTRTKQRSVSMPSRQPATGPPGGYPYRTLTRLRRACDQVRSPSIALGMPRRTPRHSVRPTPSP